MKKYFVVVLSAVALSSMAFAIPGEDEDFVVVVPKASLLPSSSLEELKSFLDKLDASNKKELNELAAFFGGPQMSVERLMKRYDLAQLDQYKAVISAAYERTKSAAWNPALYFNKLIGRGAEGILSSALSKFSEASLKLSKNTESLFEQLLNPKANGSIIRALIQSGVSPGLASKTVEREFDSFFPYRQWDFSEEPFGQPFKEALMRIKYEREIEEACQRNAFRALYYAVDLNDLRAFEMLARLVPLDHFGGGADFSRWPTPTSYGGVSGLLLSSVVREGNGQMISVLAQMGVSFCDIQNRVRRYSLMHEAAEAWNSDAIVALAQAGLDVNSKHNNLTPLHSALKRRGDPEKIISQLVALGARLDVKDGEGHTPLWYAVARGNLWGVRALEQALAKRRLLVLDPEANSLCSLIPRDLRQYTAQFLSGKVEDSLLMEAVRAGLYVRVKELIQLGHDVNPGRLHPYTPRTDVITTLMVAHRFGDPEVIAVLLENGAHADDSFKGQTASQVDSEESRFAKMLADAATQQSQAIEEELKRKHGLDTESLRFQIDVLRSVRELPENNRIEALQRLVYEMNQVLLDRNELARFSADMEQYSLYSLVDRFQLLASEGWSLLSLVRGTQTLDPQQGPPMLGYDEMKRRINDLRFGNPINTDALHSFDRQVLATLARYLARRNGDSRVPVSQDEEAAMKLLYEQLMGLPFYQIEERRMGPAAPQTSFVGEGASVAKVGEEELQARASESIEERRARFLARFKQN